jgi:hypothetical protein
LLIHGFPSNNSKGSGSMIIKKVAIFLTLFIFGIITQGWADSVKSINDAANQETTIKMDENKVAIQKKIGSAKQPIKSLKKRKVRSPSDISYSDYGAIMGSIKSDINFLKTLEEKKRSQWVESLDKVIYFYKFSQNAWRDKFLNFREVTPSTPRPEGQCLLRGDPERRFLTPPTKARLGAIERVTETKYLNSDFNQSILKPFPDGNKYFEEGRILTTLKHLEFKRVDIFKEIFMGFCLSLDPMNGHMFLEMNITPSSGKGPGFIIPF